MQSPVFKYEFGLKMASVQSALEALTDCGNKHVLSEVAR